MSELINYSEHPGEVHDRFSAHLWLSRGQEVTLGVGLGFWAELVELGLDQSGPDDPQKG